MNRVCAAAVLRMAALSLVCLSFAGCAVSDAQDFQGVIPPGKGILLVSVDTDSQIKGLVLTNSRTGWVDLAYSGIPLGRSMHTILLPAGDYAWTRVDLPDILRADGIYSPDQGVYQTWVDIGALRGYRYSFSVKAGTINYAGDFVIHGTPGPDFDWSYNTPGVHPIPGAGYQFQVIDRTAMFLDRLDPSTKALIARDGLVYSGPGADSYPAYRNSLPADPSAAASSATPTTLPADQSIPAGNFFLRPAHSKLSLSPDGRLVLMVTHPNEIYSAVAVTDLATHVETPVFQYPNPNEDFGDLQWVAADTAVFTVDADTPRATLMAMRVRREEDGRLDIQLKQWGGKYWVMQAALKPGKQAALGETYGAETDPHRCLRIADLDPGPAILDIHPCSLDLDLHMVDWQLAPDGRLLLRGIYSEDGLLHFQKPVAGSGSDWKDFKQVDPVNQTFAPVGYYRDSDHLGVLSDLGRDTVAYQEYDPDTDKVTRTLFEKPGSDVTGVHYDPVSGRFTYLTWFDGPEARQEMLSDYSRAALPALQQAFPGEQVLPTAFSPDGAVALAFVYSDTDPGRYYAFDTKSRQTQLLGEVMPWLKPEALAAEKPGSIKTRDGLSIDYLLTLPRQPAARYPLVVIPHGGPVGVFDARSFDPEAQLLASRGYAVLKVNYRGSGGKGLKFQQAGEHEWGRKIEDDIDEVVHAVLASAPLDAGRVCIFGASYGGYSALVSAAREPALYRCAASLAGVTDIPLLYDTSDVQQDAVMRKAMVDIIGDPTTDAAKLRSVSPVYLADKIQCPVLIAQGGKDRQVDPEQAYRMKAALEALHKPVVYLSYPNEGHGFDNPPDETDFYTQLLAFLDRNIGPAYADRQQATALR